MTWQLAPDVGAQGVRFNVYRTSTGGFGITPEEREKHRVAQGLTGMTYEDPFPASDRGRVSRYHYAVSMVIGGGFGPAMGLEGPPGMAASMGRESPLSRMVAVELSPEGEAKQVSTAPTAASVPRRFLVVVVGAGVLAVLFVIMVLWLLVGRRKAAAPVSFEEESKPFDDDEPWNRNEV